MTSFTVAIFLEELQSAIDRTRERLQSADLAAREADFAHMAAVSLARESLVAEFAARQAGCEHGLAPNPNSPESAVRHPACSEPLPDTDLAASLCSPGSFATGAAS